MAIDLEELERLAAQATSGPWEVGEFASIHNGFEGVATAYAGNSKMNKDAAYIVEVCNSAPELIAEHRALREKVRELERQRDWLAKLLGDLCTAQKDGECPLFYACPASGFGWSCGNAIKENWIYAAEQAAKEAGE